VQFATATQWVARLSDAKRHGSLEAELRRLSFIPLIVVDEAGYIRFDAEPPTSCSASSPAATSAPRKVVQPGEGALDDPAPAPGTDRR
jgi:IstB-like ATP binding protein